MSIAVVLVDANHGSMEYITLTDFS